MTDLGEKKQIICDFLQRANAYGDTKLAEYQAELNRAGTTNVLALVKKLEQWRSYQVFNDYALGELKTDRLDDWFKD